MSRFNTYYKVQWVHIMYITYPYTCCWAGCGGWPFNRHDHGLSMRKKMLSLGRHAAWMQQWQVSRQCWIHASWRPFGIVSFLRVSRLWRVCIHYPHVNTSILHCENGIRKWRAQNSNTMAGVLPFDVVRQSSVNPNTPTPQWPSFKALHTYGAVLYCWNGTLGVNETK